jgi:hypothetical protein
MRRGPQRHSLHEVGFEKRTPKSRYVECIICGRHGGGLTVIGAAAWIFLDQSQLNGWQKDCMRAHVFECACGLFFPKKQAIATHVAQNRRWRNPGHGAMDQVSWEPIALRAALGVSHREEASDDLDDRLPGVLDVSGGEEAQAPQDVRRDDMAEEADRGDLTRPADGDSARRPCSQCWPGGLKYGILVECDRMVGIHSLGHTGKHHSKDHSMEWWGGKLTYEEEQMAALLREPS